MGSRSVELLVLSVPLSCLLSCCGCAVPGAFLGQWWMWAEVKHVSPALSTPRQGQPERSPLGWAQHRKAPREPGLGSGTSWDHTDPAQLSAALGFCRQKWSLPQTPGCKPCKGQPSTGKKKERISAILISFPLFQPLSAIPSVQAPFPCADPSSVVTSLCSKLYLPTPLPGKSAPWAQLLIYNCQIPSSKFPSAFREPLNRKGRLQ